MVVVVRVELHPAVGRLVVARERRPRVDWRTAVDFEVPLAPKAGRSVSERQMHVADFVPIGATVLGGREVGGTDRGSCRSGNGEWPRQHCVTGERDAIELRRRAP